MAFRAFLVSIRQHEAGAEYFWVTVKYEDVVSNPIRTITKEYKYVVGTTRQEFESMVLSQRNELRQLDNAYGIFQGAVGQEITG